MAIAQDISNHFASKKTEDSRFEGVEFRRGRTGSPLRARAIASLDCTRVASHSAGDHILYVGQIEDISIHDGEPLIHFCGGYRELAS